MKVFIDTSAFYAIVDKDDENHKTASDAIKDLVSKGAELYTSNFVLSETYPLNPPRWLDPSIDSG